MGKQVVPRDKEIVECIECGDQQRPWETDAGHCRNCGGECHNINEIYGVDGEPLDQRATERDKANRQEPQKRCASCGAPVHQEPAEGEGLPCGH